MTEQDFQTIDVNYSAVQSADFSADFSADSEVCSAECSADLAKSYTAEEISQMLGVSVRSVYDYANKIIKVWTWVSEFEFRNQGVYTPKALDEMRKLKASKSITAYAASVTKETGNYTEKGGTLARVEVNETTNTLAAKPLPEMPVYNIGTVDTSAIRERTNQLTNINEKLTETMQQLIALKVANKAKELDIKIDETFAEAEYMAKKAANDILYKSVVKE